MSFLDIVTKVASYLQEHERVSLHALRLEFDLDDRGLDSLVAELVDIRQVAARTGQMLVRTRSGHQITSPGADVTPRGPAPHGRIFEHDDGERRQITVLFSDLVDSTRLAGTMDAEDWRTLVRAYQRAAASVIERYGGHIAQYLGDGLLVYFGWPNAHEDDAERAVRAGLGIVDAVRNEETCDGETLSVRVGIHTGPVVIGEMGGGEWLESLAVGDTMNIAARIQSLAAADSVVLSQSTARLVTGIFITCDLGDRTLKGVE